MARTLIFDLDRIQVSPTGRRPDFKVEIFDVRSTSDTINDVVRGNALDATTGPRDFTADVVGVSIEEVAGDFVDSGVVSQRVVLVVADPNGVFDPFNVIADPSGDGRWMRRGNVVRIREGDARVPEEDWPLTFTGILQGQAGQLRSRDVQTSPGEIAMEAVDRSAGFLKYPNTSRSFDIGTTFQDMGDDLAQSDMGLDADEVDFSGWGLSATLLPVQMVEEPPLVSIAKLMFPSGFMPIFDGSGVLTQTQALVTSPPVDRDYEDDGIFLAASQPMGEVSPANSVEIIGLDGNLSKVEQPRQTVGEVSLTTGYFTQNETVKVYWSEDRTLLAQNVDPKTVKSVNGGLSFLGGGEEFEEIPSPNGQEGSIGFRITFSTGFAPWLVVFLTATYIALAWVPDVALFGVTIPVGRALQAVALAAALLIMTKIGRGVYEFEGEPFEYVFREIRAIAEVDGLLSTDRIRVSIENHLVQTQALADSLARDVLFERQARGRPRQFTMLHDLRLEPNDVFRRPGGTAGRTYLVEKVSRTLRRGAPPVAQVVAFEITEGLQP